MSRIPVTVMIPVLNEELNLPACLAALGDAFEMVLVVDSGSTDRTGEIADAGGVEVVQFKWDGAFPKKRNWTLRNYSFRTPWVLFLDADERVTPAFIDELRRTLPDTPHAGFQISFANWFMGRPLRHGDPFRKLALFRVGAGEYEQFPENGWSRLDMEVHEHPVLDGTVGVLESPLEHHEFRGIEHYKQKHADYADWEVKRFEWLQTAGIDAWAPLTARQRFKYRHLNAWWLGPFYFAVAYLLKRGFLDGATGFRFAILKWQYFNTIRLKIRAAEQKGKVASMRD